MINTDRHENAALVIISYVIGFVTAYILYNSASPRDFEMYAQASSSQQPNQAESVLTMPLGYQETPEVHDEALATQ